jgi:hypothetical protein
VVTSRIVNSSVKNRLLKSTSKSKKTAKYKSK